MASGDLQVTGFRFRCCFGRRSNSGFDFRFGFVREERRFGACWRHLGGDDVDQELCRSD
jgi:hypothetical protein